MLQQRLCLSISLLACPVAGNSALGQIPGDYPVVAVSAPRDCEHAPSLVEASSWYQAPGAYDFWIYPVVFPSHGSIDAIRLGVTWPEEWVLNAVQLCYGTILEGGITAPGTGITVEFQPLREYGYEAIAVLRLRMEATSPGVLRLTTDPTSGEFAQRLRGGTWVPFWGSGPAGITASYVVIGEFDPCDRRPLESPEDWCGLFIPGPSGRLDLPAALRVLSGTVVVDTLDAYTNECTSIPECGGRWPGDVCFGGISSPVPWLSFHTLGGVFGGGPFRVAMTIDARGLAVGSYPTRLVVGGWCVWCLPVCYSLRLEVDPAGIEPTTWGRIKHAGR